MGNFDYKKYYEENKEKLLAANRQYYQEHKEQIKAQHKAHYQEKTEELLKQKQEYYQKNRDALREKGRQYRETHKAQINAYRRRKRAEKRWYKRGNEKLRALRGDETPESVMNGTGVNNATLMAAERGKRILSQRDQMKLAYYYSVDISELGFDDAPESMKQQNEKKQAEKAKKQKSQGAIWKEIRLKNMPTIQGAAEIIPGMLSSRSEKILDAIRHGMKPQAAWRQYQVDIETYAVFYKMLYGGLSQGKDDCRLEVRAGIKYERGGEKHG